MRYSSTMSTVALIAAALLSSCSGDSRTAGNGGDSTETFIAHRNVPSGVSIEVTLDTTLSTEVARVGDVWSGSVITGLDGIPAGSIVHGTVTAALPARKGDRAMLDLGLASITVGGHLTPAHGTTDPIIAGSPRARNLGAIGAPGGEAVVGAGAATEAAAGSVVLKSGTPLTFTTTEAMAVRQ